MVPGALRLGDPPTVSAPSPLDRRHGGVSSRCCERAVMEVTAVVPFKGASRSRDLIRVRYDWMIVTCPVCGTPNPEGAKFCGTCGAALAAVCPRCGEANPPQGKFCLECGAALGTSSLETK